MNNPHVEYLINRPRKLNPSEGYANSVDIIVRSSNTISSPIYFNIRLRSTSNDHIIRLLRNQLNNSHRWLCTELASFISATATDLGFGFNGFTVNILVKINYHNVRVLSHHPPSINHEAKILRTVLLGRINRESLESLKIATKSCSICLDDLSDSSKHGESTRMACSHVFHSNCLLGWLRSKTTCPLCRTVLYDL